MQYMMLSLILFGFLSQGAEAGEKIVVIANKALDLKGLKTGEIKAIFLGEMRFTASGQSVRIGDRDRDSSVHQQFYAELVQMTPKDISIYWARKVYTGAAIPPTRVSGDDQTTINWVRSNLDAVSYIYAKDVDNSVQVVGTLP